MAQSSWLAAVQWWLRATLWAQEERPRRLAEACGDALSPAQTVPIPTAFGDHPGSDEVLIVFSAIEKGSVFRMTYEAFPTNEIRFFSLYLSPISFAMVVVLVRELSPPRVLILTLTLSPPRVLILTLTLSLALTMALTWF